MHSHHLRTVRSYTHCAASRSTGGPGPKVRGDAPLLLPVRRLFGLLPAPDGVRLLLGLLPEGPVGCACGGAPRDSCFDMWKTSAALPPPRKQASSFEASPSDMEPEAAPGSGEAAGQAATQEAAAGTAAGAAPGAPP